MTAVVESAPIIGMSALFLTPVVQFWLWVWGPLRPFDVATVPAPSVAVVFASVGIVSAGYAAHVGWTWWAAGLVIGNVVTNLYPVLLQRYTRARLVRVVAASARRPVVTTR